MAIVIKSDDIVAKMRVAGVINRDCHAMLKSMLKPGITTGELDRAAEEFIRSKGGTPSFKGYRGYPGSINCSLNQEVIHGIPGIKVIKEGDIVSIDIGVYINGVHSDAARTYGVGAMKPEAVKLIETAEKSFFAGIEFAREGRHLYEISAAIEKVIHDAGFSPVREWIGHGVGLELHEDPEIPNFKPEGRGPLLKKGMTFAIEPMVNAGTWKTKVLKDGWTIVTADGSNSSHYENTVVITDGEPEILTL